MKGFVILPNQLFQDTRLLVGKKVYLVEEPLYFYDIKRPYNYHKAKLAFMVASMKYYHQYLIKSGIESEYVPFEQMSGFKVKDYEMYDPVDHLVKQRYTPTKYHDNIGFLMSTEQLSTFNDLHPQRTVHASFFDFVRNELKVLQGVPSTDKENRLSFPKNHKPVQIPRFETKWWQEAIEYIDNHKQFKDNPGLLDSKYLSVFPTTFEDADLALERFLEERFDKFGPYEDAIHQTDPFGYHSNLSAIINLGLLSPRKVLDRVLDHCQKHKIPKDNQNLEGFVRQLIGWREYMRYLYMFKDLKTNHFNSQNRLIWTKWYKKVGLLPLDNELTKIEKYGFCHHIIRLMVFLNMFVLLQVHPDDVVRWFSEMVAMDAYEWVMVSNIYAMGYYYPKAMKKPYISTSNYILKMSNYPKGDWTGVWDALFYRFLHTNRKQAGVYARNLGYFEKMDKEKQNQVLERAEKFMKQVIQS
ncbi:DNA photolyase, FAD-binding/Cryptochrome [Gorgonomyces haynaldii]|nr:DNA photolyase, FAD-binding/Cryptochrome [Gorgonomyces haynaldii]